MTTSTPTVCTSTPLVRGKGLRPFLRALIQAPALARQRRMLAELDAIRLRDIGVTPEQARDEASRPFWDAPTYWR